MVAIFISIAALTVSCVALWKSHLAPFSVLTVAGTLHHRIYPFRSGERRWFLSSFDVPLTVTNQGAKPGLITGMRLRLHFPDVAVSDNCETIPAKWELRPDKANEINKNRLSWIPKVVAADWIPFVILPKVTVSKHLMFETSWDRPVIQARVSATLEFQASNQLEWTQVTTWKMNLRPEAWSHMADAGRAIGFHPDQPRFSEPSCFPPNLRELTGTDEPIPREGFNWAPSTLDYPES